MVMLTGSLLLLGEKLGMAEDGLSIRGVLDAEDVAGYCACAAAAIWRLSLFIAS